MNFYKSRFGGIGVDQQSVKRYAKYLNCKILSIPFVYLGIPIEANPRRKETWEPIITKFKKKLATWRHKHLTIAGRIRLINSALSSLPLFYMSFLKFWKGWLENWLLYKEDSCGGVKMVEKKFLGLVGTKFVQQKTMRGWGLRVYIFVQCSFNC